MKKAIRCCISCILPCGSLDVIRIVHANGRVEEISGTIRASEVMKAYPKHVLKKPTSSIEADVKMPRIVILPPDAQLERGKIYFLTPLPPTPLKKKKKKKNKPSSAGAGRHGGVVDKEVVLPPDHHESNKRQTSVSLLSSDQYLSELLSEEKLSNQRERRRGRVGVWRPHLHSICESDSST